MNISSALLKQIVVLQDYDTWSSLRKHYLATEYQVLFSCIEKHYDKFHCLPTFEDLKLSVRDGATRDKILAIESIEVEVDAYMLLEYLKNEYTQKEILDKLEPYVDNCVAFENAEESLQKLHQIVIDVEALVELGDPTANMQRMNLFEDDEELGKYLALGLNTEFDSQFTFSPQDLILIGGHRGSGKSLTCANISVAAYNRGKTALYFTIEMDAKQTMQRCASVATGIDPIRLRHKNLSVNEWETLAAWWAGRYVGGDTYLAEYYEHRSFDQLHQTLSTKAALNPERQIDIIYDPKLTIAKIESEVRKKVATSNIEVIVVDYLNQVYNSLTPTRPGGRFDWIEQMEVARKLKDLAQEYNIPVVCPYQTDKSGEARMSKGILDSCDAAFALSNYMDDNCIHFECVKMRNGPMVSFTSATDPNSLRIGPETGVLPDKKEKSTGEEIADI